MNALSLAALLLVAGSVPVRWLNRLPDKLPLQPPRLPTSGSKVWELNLDLAGNTVRCGDRSFPLPAKPWWAQIVRLFLDGSVTECFVCGTEAPTSRVYGPEARRNRA